MLAGTMAVAALAGGAGVAAEEEVELRAAVVKVDITPAKPVRMSGYAGRKEESTGVHDPLSLRVTVFEDGDTRLVLVSADLIGFYGAGEAFRQAICERYGLQPSELFLAGIHTHSGPTPTLSEDGFANNVEYTKEPAGEMLWRRSARPSEHCALCRSASVAATARWASIDASGRPTIESSWAAIRTGRRTRKYWF